MSSKIEWTEDTWNPLIGCDKISAGCKNCYAIKTAWVRQHNPAMAEKYAGVVEKTANGSLNWTGKINFHQPSLLKPLNTKKPTVFFVNSMSDLFHESVPFEYINAIFSVMSDCDWHTYQVLTKRAQRMYEFFEWKRAQFGISWSPKDNVWIGVSVEDQKTADERIPWLLGVPVKVKFLSCEPLLGPVDIMWFDLQFKVQGPGIGWVICGGESGPNSRPMHPDWARSIRDQCEVSGIPFFFKQWGNWMPIGMPKDEESVVPLRYNEQWLNVAGGMGFHGEEVWRMRNVGKKAAARSLDGKVHNEYPTLQK